MGTRHLTIVVSNNEYKVAQYGQWDGYPTGQGADIAKFIMANLQTPDGVASFKNKVDACRFGSNEEIVALQSTFKRDGFADDDYKAFERLIKEYPEYSRDTGSQILDLISNSVKPRMLQNSIEFANDSLFCEWAWLLNLDNNTLEVYKGFNKRKLGKTQRFHSDAQPDEDKYYPVRLFETIKFDDITATTMDELDARRRIKDKE
jgi:hypothetical protein